MTQHDNSSSYGSELATEKGQQTMNGGTHLPHIMDSKQPRQETVDAGLKSLDHCTSPPTGQAHVPLALQVPFTYKPVANMTL